MMLYITTYILYSIAATRYFKMHFKNAYTPSFVLHIPPATTVYFMLRLMRHVYGMIYYPAAPPNENYGFFHRVI